MAAAITALAQEEWSLNTLAGFLLFFSHPEHQSIGWCYLHSVY
jgi:hypothetical protein